MGMMFRVTAVESVSRDAKRFRLQRLDKKPVETFEPGAHIVVTIKDAATGTQGTRSYTLTSRPSDREGYEITVGVNADAGGISGLFHSAVRPGRVVTVSGPENSFRLVTEPAPCLLIAGGIGITPILAMARWLDEAAHPFHVLYSGKSEDSMPYLDELRAMENAQCVVVTTRSPAMPRLDFHPIFSAMPDEAHVYVCGPKEMIDSVFDVAKSLGWSAGRVHAESFTAMQSLDDLPFTVELARSGRRIDVAPGSSILDALVEGGVEVDYDCRHGSCGRCTQQVLSGEPDHKDSWYAKNPQPDWIRICVSRSRSPLLVLDL